MNKEHRDSLDSLFDYIYKCDPGAKSLSIQLLELSQVWDDLIDKDNPVSNSDINSAFESALFSMPSNPLWYQCGLNHHVLSVYLQWRDATHIENNNPSDDDLNKCYMLRAAMYDIFVVIAFHLYGSEWVQDVGPKIRRFYGEKLSEYKEEFTNA